MSAAIELKLNEMDLTKVQTMLTGVKNGAPKVIVSAVNKTLDGVKTDSDKEIRSIITMKKKDVMATFSTRKASVRILSARVACSSVPVPLIKFTNSRTKKGISVKVLKSSTRTVLNHAFYATMKSGHKGIFAREGQGPSRPVRQNIAYGALPRKYRLPIRELTGPRVSDIMGKPNVMQKITAQANDRLHKNINNELNYALSRL